VQKKRLGGPNQTLSKSLAEPIIRKP